jgi:hypothetical protein
LRRRLLVLAADLEFRVGYTLEQLASPDERFDQGSMTLDSGALARGGTHQLTDFGKLRRRRHCARSVAVEHHDA